MAEQTELLSQWFRTFDGANADVTKFYGSIENAVGSRGVPDVTFSRPHFKEGGLLSASREYLRIERGDLRYEIGAAPFGRGFFVSARLFAQGKFVDSMVGDMKSGGLLGQVSGLLTSKVLGVDTYYKLDTAQAFLQLTHGALMEAVDALTTAANILPLSDSERRPILKGFFQ